MILTDGSHLVSDESLQELHGFAQCIGLRLDWFQDHGIPHYDIFGRMGQHARIAGARRVTSRELVRRAIR